MTSTGSYVPTQQPDAAAEAARLRAQAQAIFAREDAVLRAAGLGDGATLLDVGCGPGHWLAALSAAHRPALALGVERDVNHARTAAASGARVVRGDALQLPLADASVDAVTMRLVLRHLPSPPRALTELLRVVRPGGHVAVLDADDGGLLLHEAPASFPPLWDALTLTARRRGANPQVGRALLPLLTAAGLTHVSLTPLPVTTVDLAAPAFVELLLAPDARPVDEDLLPATVVARSWADLRAWARGPNAFGLALGMVAVGVKPR
jgi:SAM-dependent methyltransferase